ncbi:cell filamentation protein Fic [Candidatus Gracilibacteria bacterium]|nr:cell filamentation protein Fic [Candidatus Gracilibacteria bacterium]
MKTEVILYTSKYGDIKVSPILKDNTFWLSQVDIAKLFGKGRTTITEHIGNIFKEEELTKSEVILNVGNSDNSVGKGKSLYNLDMIISVGYRVNSKEASSFVSGQPEF